VLILLPLLAFALASLLVVAAAYALAPSPAAALERRLGEVTGTTLRPVAEEESGYGKSVVALLKRLGNIAPKSASETSKLQQRLVAAGYRHSEAIVVFFGIRIGVALAAFGVFSSPIVMEPDLTFALIACLLGYVLPGMVLARIAKARQHKIRLGLPDALDLLVVSVEAGLGLDQAILRVADEMSFAHPELCGELRLINLELRAGKARAEALQNLADRTGVDDVSSLVAMLIQTDKFGTSLAQSLRVHSDTMRTKRRQRAEEAAAKTGVKMVFPLVFCIFPAIWVVSIGPAVIKFIETIGGMKH
jgi:tight adherence protein C